MPLVSVIIPAHNPGRFLRETLESVCAQTFTDWELLVIDDNSTEDLSWVPVDFPRARLIRQRHGGVSIARNNGILQSTGEFIAFLDQDDLFHPVKLQRQVAALQSMPDAALCYCDLEYIDSDSKPFAPGASGGTFVQDPAVAVELDGAAPLPAGEKITRLHQSVLHFATRFVVPGTTLIRRSALAHSGLMDPFIPFCGDYDLIIKLGARYKVLHIPSADLLYRRHPGSFTSQYDVGRREVEALIARYVAFAKAQGDHLLASRVKSIFRRPGKMYSAQAFDCARASLRRRQYKSLAYHLMRAFFFSPTFVLGSLTRYRPGTTRSAGSTSA
ncbi:MAG TPA: glycosyltransferase [Phycisphaerae bacterium]|nr:glycosyltransferase [Phycisphaerae bacterium]